MDKTTKTVLIIIGSLLLCVCGAAILSVTGIWSVAQIVNWADTNTTEDLYEVADMANEIAIFTLPDGYSSPYGVHIGEITFIGFSSPSRNTHLLLAQFPNGTVVDVEEMLKQVNRYSKNPDSSWYAETTLIEEKPVSIRGQETTLNISEGTSSDGVRYRSAVANFPGKHGPALVMIAGPIDEWDIVMVEEFIASIQ